MHDVSEGGLKGCLYEAADSLGMRVEVSTKRLHYSKGALDMGEDPLRGPSYGTLMVVADPTGAKGVKDVCSELGLPCVDVGSLSVGSGLFIDGDEVAEQRRIHLDEIYGSLRGGDEVTSTLERCLERLPGLPGLVRLIPQVGLNMLYSKPGPVDAGDVAGLSGRVVAAAGEPLVCGEVRYGASRFLASVLVEAARIDPSVRSAVNVRGGEDMQAKLEALGLRVEMLPVGGEAGGCPVAHFIASRGELRDAYVHPGGLGVEATTTILARSPEELVDVLGELARA